MTNVGTIAAWLTLLHMSAALPATVTVPGRQACLLADAPAPARMEVYVAVSSVASYHPSGATVQRQLELYWHGDVPRPGDSVALYREDPTGNITSPPLTIVDPTLHPQGWYRTQFMLERRSLVELGFQSQCLYWIAYFRGDALVATGCLKTQPTWLWDMRSQLGNLTLGELMIPGTHDSGAWQEYRGILSENLATKYAICQDEDLLHQLLYGIRYLDLRVGYYPAMPEKFFVVHGIMRLYPFRDVFPLLKTFLDNTQEIVLIDLHGFEAGFSEDPSAHQQFISLLQRELLWHLAPSSAGWSATLDNVWGSGQVILSYNHPAAAGNPHLWPPPGRCWGNINQGAAELHSYLQTAMQAAASHPEQASEPWVAMAELTPSAFDVIGDKFGGLRKMADLVNREVTRWFRDQWGSTASIVATDFFLGNNIIDVCIAANKRRAKCPQTLYQSRFEKTEAKGMCQT